MLSIHDRSVMSDSTHECGAYHDNYKALVPILKLAAKMVIMGEYNYS